MSCPNGRLFTKPQLSMRKHFGFAEVSLESTLASPKFLWRALWLRRSFPLSHFPTFDIWVFKFIKN